MTKHGKQSTRLEPKESSNTESGLFFRITVSVHRGGRHQSSWGGGGGVADRPRSVTILQGSALYDHHGGNGVNSREPRVSALH